MYESIKNFNKQFLYEPEIINQKKLTGKKSFAVVGMGGSALAPLFVQKMETQISTHQYELLF